MGSGRMLVWARSSLTEPLLKVKIKGTVYKVEHCLCLTREGAMQTTWHSALEIGASMAHFLLMDSWMQTPVCLSLLEMAIARHLQQRYARLSCL